MQWYHVQMRQDETVKMNGHLRSGSASEAVRIALGRERRWPVQETGRDAARAIDPENPENWCKASGVKGPTWPVTKEAPEKKKTHKRVKKTADAAVKAPVKSIAKSAATSKAPATGKVEELAADQMEKGAGKIAKEPSRAKGSRKPAKKSAST